jgi:hypothetical protein
VRKLSASSVFRRTMNLDEASSQRPLKPAHLVVERDVRHDPPPLHLPVAWSLLLKAGTLGQHSNESQESRKKPAAP